jgi:hypothetical protein
VALRDAWEAEYAEVYGEKPQRSVADNQGYHRVIGVDPAVFRERARRALRATGFLRCGTAAKLTSGEVWNQLAGPSPPPNGAQKRTMAAVGNWDDPNEAKAVPQ